MKKQTVLIIISVLAVLCAIVSIVIAANALNRLNGITQRLEQLENAAASHTVPCQLALTDWDYDGNTLTLLEGSARIGSEAVQMATLELWLGDTCAESQLLEIFPSEAIGQSETDLAGLRYTLAEENLQQAVELRLSVQLTDGQTGLAVCGGWSYEDGQLLLISG